MRICDIMSKNDFILALCAFLDEFERSGASAREAMLQDGPAESGGCKLCLLAGIEHMLANKNNMATPSWAMHERCFLKEPAYSLDTKNADCQEYLRANAPEEFAIRNIYISGDAIMRV